MGGSLLPANVFNSKTLPNDLFQNSILLFFISHNCCCLFSCVLIIKALCYLLVNAILGTVDVRGSVNGWSKTTSKIGLEFVKVWEDYKEA